MTESLFRQEALDAKKHSFLGSISIAQPMSLWVYAGGGLVCACLIVTFLILGEYTRRTTVVGSLVPNLGLATLVAPIQGVVNSTSANEGDMVRKGQSLISIGQPRLSTQGIDVASQVLSEIGHRKAALEEMGAAKLQQTDAQISGLGNQLLLAEKQRLQMISEIQTKREQVKLAQGSLKRYESLAGSQYISQIQLEQQKNTVLSFQADLQAFERQLNERQSGISQLRQSVQELQAQRRSLLASGINDRASLTQEQRVQEGNAGVSVQSPVDGLVSSRIIEPGQVVQAGQPLLSVLPKSSKLEAHLLVPSSAMGFIAPGDKVLLRYQAYPYQKFGHYSGTVKALTRNVVSNDSQNKQSYYRAIVQLDTQSVLAYGKQEPLRPGLAMEADILGDTRKLYEWLFEPVYALKGKLGN
jgi:membrane fusion protein